MVKNAINVKNVGRPLIMAQNLYYIREFTEVRNNVRNVGRPLDSDHNLLNIKDYILMKNPMNISSVGRLL